MKLYTFILQHGAVSTSDCEDARAPQQGLLVWWNRDAVMCWDAAGLLSVYPTDEASFFPVFLKIYESENRNFYKGSRKHLQQPRSLILHVDWAAEMHELRFCIDMKHTWAVQSEVTPDTSAHLVIKCNVVFSHEHQKLVVCVQLWWCHHALHAA